MFSKLENTEFVCMHLLGKDKAGEAMNQKDYLMFTGQEKRCLNKWPKMPLILVHYSMHVQFNLRGHTVGNIQNSARFLVPFSPFFQ